MSKQPKRTGEISVEDMRVWTEYLATGAVNDEAHEKQLKRLSQRSVNLADVATIVDFMARRNDGYITGLIEQNGMMEIVLDKLGATPEMKAEAKKEYEEQLEDIQKQIKEAQEKLMSVKDTEWEEN